MARKIDPKILSQVLDCVDGAWSVIVNDLLLCYGMVGGTKSKLAIALFDRVTRSIKLRKDPFEASHTKEKKGSIWSNPMRIEEIVSTCTSVASLEQSIQNYRRYLNELVEGNLFYRFGRSGHYAYTYERNVCSWACFSSGEAYVYPTLVKKILASESDLWLLFWNQSKNAGEASVLTLDGFTLEFAKFVDGLLDRLAPVAKAKCRRFDPREAPRLYLNEITGIVNDMDDFKGFAENATFDLSKLPASVAQKYHQTEHGKLGVEAVLADIIPEEEGGLAPKRKGAKRLTQRALLSIDRYIVEQSMEANTVSDANLSPKDSSRHMLSLLERKIKRIKGLPDNPNFVISKNPSAENFEWQKVVDSLTDANSLSNSFIREWVDWFVVNHMAKRDIDSKTILIRELHKTFIKFMSVRTQNSPDTVNSTIYEDMRRRYDGIEALEFLCLKYGFFLPYNFLHVKFGVREACLAYEDMFQRLDSLPDPVRRKNLSEMVRMTCSRSPRSYLLKVGSPMMMRLDEFLKKNACTFAELGVGFSADSDVSERAFWRKIVSENREPSN